MRISDWSSDVCSSDLRAPRARARERAGGLRRRGAVKPRPPPHHLFCVHARCGYTARMTRFAPSRASTRLLAAALVITPMLAACAGGGGVKKDTRYVARDVNTLYRAAQDRLDRKQYGLAAALVDEVESQHPYSPWARRAQLMSAFSYYMDREYTPRTEEHT